MPSVELATSWQIARGESDVANSRACCNAQIEAINLHWGRSNDRAGCQTGVSCDFSTYPCPPPGPVGADHRAGPMIGSSHTTSFRTHPLSIGRAVGAGCPASAGHDTETERTVRATTPGIYAGTVAGEMTSLRADLAAPPNFCEFLGVRDFEIPKRAGEAEE
jgi:hypothetical protein